MDRIEDGIPFRILNIVDNFTHECLAAHPERLITGEKVSQVLTCILRTRACPQSIRVDNGSEFYSRAMDSWAYVHKVALAFIRPGKPRENEFVESFNGRMRDELLKTELFFRLQDAREKLSRWVTRFGRISR